ncbi:MAG: hypothetical protein OHK0029_07720 [Armatimonadaceae bacterium]
MRLTRKIASTVVALVAIATGAQAQTFVQNASFGLATTNWLTNFNFARFDQAIANGDIPLGSTLTGVTWEISGRIVGTFSIDNDNATARNFFPNANGTISLSALPGVTGGSISINPTFNTVVNLAADNGDGATVDYTGPDGIAGGTASSSVLNNSASATTLAGYSGLGTLAVDSEAIAFAGVSGSGNFQSQITTQAEVNAILTYTYEVSAIIPEPSTAGLLAFSGVGAVGFAVMRRRRNKK